MTTISTGALAGDTWSNVIDDELIVEFQYMQIAPLALSGDNLSITFSFFGGDTTTFYSDVGFGLNPPTGVINSIETVDTFVDGLNIGLSNWFAMIRDGDADALNAAVWGGADVINGGASDDYIRGFTGSDRLYGFGGNDRLLGDGGSDRLYGGSGSDILFGGAGNDILFGQADGDRLNGGAGNDSLNGGAGRDDMTGGTGADTFIWTSTADFAPIVGGQPFSVDFIRDFNRAEGDKINLSGVDADAALGGNQEFTFIGTNAFAANTPGQAHIVATANPFIWRIELNTDADADADYAIMMIGPSPVATDFIL